MPAAGFAIDLLPGRGLLRSVTPRALAQNVAHASCDTRRARSCVALAVGAPAPAARGRRRRRLRVAAGASWRPGCGGVPAVVHEADAHPGLANRIAVRLGARPAVTLPGTPLPGAVVTGNPIRPAIAAVQPGAGRRRRWSPSSAGASAPARSTGAALGLYDRWRDRADVTIHHVAGARDYEECRTRLAALRAPGRRARVPTRPVRGAHGGVYTEATVVVCRGRAA